MKQKRISVISAQVDIREVWAVTTRHAPDTIQLLPLPVARVCLPAFCLPLSPVPMPVFSADMWIEGVFRELSSLSPWRGVCSGVLCTEPRGVPNPRKAPSDWAAKSSGSASTPGGLRALMISSCSVVVGSQSSGGSSPACFNLYLRRASSLKWNVASLKFRDFRPLALEWPESGLFS